jgi:predicted Zn-dependent peptidase
MLLKAAPLGYPEMTLMDLKAWHASQDWKHDSGKTGTDETVFGGTCPPEQFPAFCRYINAYVRSPSFGGVEHSIELMQNERLQEALGGADSDAEYARVVALCRDPHLAAILSDRCTFDGLTREAAMAFHHRYYEAPNMDLIVIGNLDEAAAFETIEASFPPGRQSFVVPPRPAPPSFLPPRKRTFLAGKRASSARVRNAERGIDEPSVMLSYSWIAPYAELWPLKVALAALDRILEDRLRERMGVSYGPASLIDGTCHGFISLAFDFTIPSQHECRARRMVAKACRDADAIVLASASCRKELTNDLRHWDYSISENFDLALYDLVAGGRIISVAERCKEIEAVTEERLRSALAKWLAPERSFLVITGD